MKVEIDVVAYKAEGLRHEDRAAERRGRGLRRGHQKTSMSSVFSATSA